MAVPAEGSKAELGALSVTTFVAPASSTRARTALRAGGGEASRADVNDDGKVDGQDVDTTILRIFGVP